MTENDVPQSSIAVLIDFENLALGTGKRNRRGHQEPGPLPDVKLILERSSTRAASPQSAPTATGNASRTR